MPLAGFAQERHADAPTALRVAAASPDVGTTVALKMAAIAPRPETAGASRCDAEMDERSLRELVQSEAKRIGVDEKLALVILAIESRDGVDLNSPKGARGPMQLMPATAEQYGVKEICNPVENVRGGVAYLKDLSAQFDGNPMLIAAAYNAGSERVYKANGVPAIPETVRYVANTVNRYYGLNALATRRGKAPARSTELRSTPTDASSPTAPEKAESPRRQEWIGGTVLYVSNTSEGEN